MLDDVWSAAAVGLSVTRVPPDVPLAVKNTLAIVAVAGRFVALDALNVIDPPDGAVWLSDQPPAAILSESKVNRLVPQPSAPCNAAMLVPLAAERSTTTGTVSFEPIVTTTFDAVPACTPICCADASAGRRRSHTPARVITFTDSAVVDTQDPPRNRALLA